MSLTTEAAGSTQQLGVLEISHEEHHRIRALSNSGMKDLAVSTLRYWYRNVNPAPRVEDEEKSSTRMGSALHCAVLESDEAFESRYARALDPSDWPVCLDTMQELRAFITDKGEKPKGTRKDEAIAQALAIMERTGERVPILAEEERRFYAQHGQKTILSCDEWSRLAGMAGALAEETALARIIRDGKPEVSLVARDPETGVLLKARLDWLSPVATLDLKTFSQQRGKSIDKSIHDAIYYERYWIQAYLYSYVRRLVLGDKADFVMAFVESDQPHETRLKKFVAKAGGEAMLYWETARIEVRRLIRLYADCLAKWGDDPWRESQDVTDLHDEDVTQFAFRNE